MTAMRKTFFARRLLALAAAYVVALQLALLPLTLAAGQAQAGPLCSVLAGKSEPLKADGGCACAAGCGAQCHAPGYPGEPADVVAPAREQAGVFRPVRALSPAACASIRSPQNPRAPPAA